MLALDLIPGRRWLHCRQLDEPYEYEPRSNCHEPITMALTAVSSLFAAAPVAAAGTAAVAGTAAAATAGTAAGLFGTGIGLAELGTVASIGGTLLQVKSGMDNASYQSAMARAEAAALKQKANEEAAVGQRVAITKGRTTDLALSKARALAAASGTDATSVDIVNTEGQIAAQGEYNALSAIYEGQSRARSSNYQAEIDLFRSQRIDAGAPLAAGGTLLSGLSTLAKDRQRNYLLGGA